MVKNMITTEYWTAPDERGLRSFHSTVKSEYIISQIKGLLTDVDAGSFGGMPCNALDLAEWISLNPAFEGKDSPEGDFFATVIRGNSEGDHVEIYARGRGSAIFFASIKYLGLRDFAWKVARALTDAFERGAYHQETPPGKP
jgi:hypothetical protein